jgi:hypothetical protein
MDHEREIYSFEIFDWLLSLGKRPPRRPLPSQRMVRIIRHVQSALQRLTISRLSDADRKHLGDLLNLAVFHAEERLRQRVRPVLIAVMEDVGLTPTNAPERTAFDKMVEEFLDRIIDSGFVTFGDLRDTISRNQLKMPDLSGPQEFIRGDPLLRLDRRLATLLDGVYRPSEIYMRWLERATALGFGTKVGRFLSHVFLIPFGAAFVVVESVHFLSKYLHGPRVEAVNSVVAWAVEGAVTEPDPWNVLVTSLWVLIGLIFMACIFSETVRTKCKRLARASGRALRKVLIEAPVKLLTLPTLQRILGSWTVQLTYWYVIKPGLVCFVLWLLVPYLFQSLVSAAAVFLVVNIAINSHTGLALGETVLQGSIDLFHMLRSGLLLGLYNFIVVLFKQLTHFVEYLLFSVDEFLRFRKGESEASQFVRGLLSAFWSPIAFILRFYWIVLIEPMVNPIKLPICLIAGKLFIPFYVPVQEQFAGMLTPVLGPPGWWIAWVTVYLLPDLCGFLIWEFKENWSLYRANRPTQLRPVRIGHHGETMRGLLQPGFHSGTVPHLFDRLRRAERAATRLGNWRALRSYRQSLEKVKSAVRKFVTREMVSLVHQATSWGGRPLRAGDVRLATNRIEIELRHEGHPGESVWLGFESRSTWLVAGIREQGWLKALSGEAFWVFVAGLTYLYKVAGVDIVHEQVRAALPEHAQSYDVGSDSLAVRVNGALRPAVYYPFQQVHGKLLPRHDTGETNLEWPLLEARRVLFARSKLTWKQLVRAWQENEYRPGESQFVPATIGLFRDGERLGETNGSHPASHDVAPATAAETPESRSA